MRMMLQMRCLKKLSVSPSILPVFHKKRLYVSFRPSSNQSTYIVFGTCVAPCTRPFEMRSVFLEHLDTALASPSLYISVLLGSLGHTHSCVPFHLPCIPSRIGVENGMLRSRRTSGTFKNHGKFFMKVLSEAFHNYTAIIVAFSCSRLQRRPTYTALFCATFFNFPRSTIGKKLFCR